MPAARPPLLTTCLCVKRVVCRVGRMGGLGCAHLLVLLLLFLVGRDAGASPSSFFGAGGGGGAFQPRSSQRDNSLYELLGVDRSASTAEITKAYRMMAMKHHPDKGGDEEQFKSLNEAYEVLSDETTRANYDRFGTAGAAGGQQAGAAADFARDLFRGFGGGGFGGFSMPLVYQLDLSLEDLFKGRDLSIPIGRMKVQVAIQPGMMTGQELILRGQFIDDRGMERDVVFRVQETRHPLFQRRNADLLVDLTISLADSLLGFEKRIPSLDGRTLVLCSKKGECFGTGDVLIVAGQGMPVYNQPKTRGRLFVRIRVDVPRKLWCSKDDAAELERLLGLSGQPRSFSGDGGGGGVTTGEEKGSGAKKTTGKKAAAGGKKRGTSGGNGEEAFTLSRGDLSSFGGIGAQEEEDDGSSNPFAQFFFR